MTGLAELGARICIMGPSNSGKSTMAVAIARARGMGAVHLDQLYHRPGTDWVARPAGEFAALHEAAVAGGVLGDGGELLAAAAAAAGAGDGVDPAGCSYGRELVSVCAAMLVRSRPAGGARGGAGQRAVGDDALHCGGDAGESEAVSGDVWRGGGGEGLAGLAGGGAGVLSAEWVAKVGWVPPGWRFRGGWGGGYWRVRAGSGWWGQAGSAAVASQVSAVWRGVTGAFVAGAADVVTVGGAAGRGRRA